MVRRLSLEPVALKFASGIMIWLLDVSFDYLLTAAAFAGINGFGRTPDPIAVFGLTGAVGKPPTRWV